MWVYCGYSLLGVCCPIDDPNGLAELFLQCGGVLPFLMPALPT